MTVMDSNGVIELNIYKRADKTMYYRMFLRSKIKPTLKSYSDVEYGSENIEKRMRIAGGAVAEYQNETYGDSHEPEDIANAALKAYESLKKKLEAV